MAQDQALAHERLAKHCTRRSHDNDARYCFDRAVELYKHWGTCTRTELLSSDFLLRAPKIFWVKFLLKALRCRFVVSVA